MTDQNNNNTSPATIEGNDQAESDFLADSIQRAQTPEVDPSLREADDLIRTADEGEYESAEYDDGRDEEYSDSEGRFEGDLGFDPYSAAEHQQEALEAEAMGEQALGLVGDALDRHDDIAELAENLPGIGTQAALAEIVPLLQEVAQIHGRPELAQDPILAAACYEYTGGEARWAAEVESDAIRRDLVGHLPGAHGRVGIID